jgi:CBS domain-containing protein
MVTMHRLQDVPRDKWKTTRIAQVMIPAEKLVGVRQDDELTEVLEKMGRADVNQLPVFDADRFVGMVTRSSIIVFLRAHAQDHGAQSTGLPSKA